MAKDTTPTNSSADPPDHPPPAAATADGSDPAATPARSANTREKQRRQEAAERFKATDDANYDIATGGTMKDPAMVDNVLALGGDATRSSPSPSQPLADYARPGLTTTTGAHRTPIDPTTAAVPAAPDDEITERMRGAATVGSGRQHDTPEQRWKKPDHNVVDDNKS